ncbi:MAG: hypothetical protein RIT26_715 [Pseudomonadota bacterium]
MVNFNWSQCLICRRWPVPTLCPDCRQRHTALLPRCPHCALALPPGRLQCNHDDCRRDLGWHTACARVDYVLPFDGWIRRLKFAGDWALARTMGQLMRECPLAQSLWQQADWIVPMPVSGQRLRERGYNQAAWLARQWGGRDRRLRMGGLVKCRHTPAQAQNGRERRWAQLQGSMQLTLPVQDVKGARVLLVDDVMTTGATLSVATECVLQAGARRVDVAVFARTPPKPGLH